MSPAPRPRRYASNAQFLVTSTLLILVVMLSWSPAPAQTIILDTTMDIGQWSEVEYYDFSGTGTFQIEQIWSNGFRVAQRVILQMNAVNFSGVGVWTTLRTQNYFPSVNGTIGYLDASISARIDTATTATQVYFEPTIIQFGQSDSLLFVGSARAFAGTALTSWTSINWTSMTADSFDNQGSGPLHPDFSNSGGRMQFGLTVSYNAFRIGPTIVMTRLDNFRVALFNCAGDPFCDAVVNVQDVIETIDVAFRSGSSQTDPGCGWDRSDLDCDGGTDVVDVIRIVNVAFRGFDPATQFCDPCP